MQRFKVDDAASHFKVLGGTPHAQVATMVLQPDQSTGGPDNRHDSSDQWLYVIRGRGRATIAGESVSFGPGELLLIEAGETHEIACAGDEPLVTFNIYSPPEY